MKKRTDIATYLIIGMSCVILAVGAGGLTACGDDYGAGGEVSSVVYAESDTENMADYTMRIESAEPGGITFTIVNNTDEEIKYGTDFVLKQYVDNDWTNVTPIITSYRFNKGFYSIPAQSSVSADLNWEWLYSTLPDGEYMISKTILEKTDDGNYDQVTLYAEFGIAEP